MKKVLIAGANGLIGASLAERLLARGSEVFALSRGIPAVPGVQVVECDLGRDLLPTAALPANIDCVFYLAQSRRFREFPEGADDVLRVNVSAPLQLAQWAREAGVRRFMYASTGGVYERSDQPLDENAPLAWRANTDFYVASKLAAETMLRCFGKQLEVGMLRYFFVYGPRQKATMLMPRLIESVSTGKPLQLAGGDGMRLNPIFVDDAAAATIACAEAPVRDAVNIAGLQVVTMRELGCLIGGVVDVEPRFESTPGTAADLVADASVMLSIHPGPYVGLREGLGSVFRAAGLSRS